MNTTSQSPEITPVEVQLGAAPQTRDDAVRAAGSLLIEAGFAEDGFTDSLLKREQTATTFLGQGVAIPHGMIDEKHLVKRTGLGVVQVPNGVVWGKDAEGNDQVVKLVVGIAAASDEHIKVLRRLTRLMRDDTPPAETHHHGQRRRDRRGPHRRAAWPRPPAAPRRWPTSRSARKSRWATPTACMRVRPASGSRASAASNHRCTCAAATSWPMPAAWPRC